LQDPDDRVRLAAVRILINGEDVAPALWAVVETLIAGWYHPGAAELAVIAPLARDPRIASYLGGLLADPAAATRRAAAGALAAASPQAELREALGALCADPDAWVADAAYRTLTQWAQQETGDQAAML
jgi:hypothetical protein